jgi:gliding motility-associated-like protein
VLTINVPGYKNYLWNTGEQSSSLAISSFGTHYLIVTDYNNCSGTDTINIIRKNCMYIGIPNAFTPNKDTRNDLFKPIINQVIKQYSFVVYNRYGQKIFETHDYNKGWDGTYKGKDQPIGTYVYRILYTNIFGYESVNNGTVMLLR